MIVRVRSLGLLQCHEEVRRSWGTRRLLEGGCTVMCPREPIRDGEVHLLPKVDGSTEEDDQRRED